MFRVLVFDTFIALNGLAWGLYLVLDGSQNRSASSAGIVLVGAVLFVTGLAFLQIGLRLFLRYKG